VARGLAAAVVVVVVVGIVVGLLPGAAGGPVATPAAAGPETPVPMGALGGLVLTAAVGSLFLFRGK
jgi:hypothetical protein